MCVRKLAQYARCAANSELKSERDVLVAESPWTEVSREGGWY